MKKSKKLKKEAEKNEVNKFRPSVARRKLLTDFYVFDVETKVSYDEYCKQQKVFNPDFMPDNTNENAIYWGLASTPENFVFGCITGFNFSKVIYNVEDFKKEFKNPKYKNRYIFAHNATYDLSTIYGNIFKHLDNEALFVGSKFISATNGNCKFADSMNIFIGQSVKKIGEALKFEKDKLGDSLVSPNGVTAKEINYCLRDCEIVWTALYKIFEKVGNIKITIASLSLTLFKNKYLNQSISFIPHTEKQFQKSYYGGRTECYYLGKCDAHVFDINSMYPYVMQQTSFPTPILSQEIKNPNNLNFYLKNFEGIFFGVVEHKANSFGLLPIKQNFKTIFPTGTFAGQWNFNELRYAISTKKVKIISCEKIIFSPPMETPFKKYVTELYEEKEQYSKEGDIFNLIITKYFLNCLYGKFGTKADSKTVYMPCYTKSVAHYIDELKRNNKFKRFITFNETRDDFFIEIFESHLEKLNYAITSFASYITSAARVELNKLLFKYEKNKILYCDTDSIFVENPAGIKTGTKIGELKLEDKRVTLIRGLKSYNCVVKGKTTEKIKGIPKNARKISDTEYEYFNLSKTKESLRSNKLVGIFTERKKEIKIDFYDKGQVQKNKSITPFHFEKC